MTCHHVGVELVAQCESKHHRVQEDSRLSHFGLTQVFLGAVKHEVGNTESQHFVGFLKQFFGLGVALVEVFAHAHELSPLAGEYKCFHVVNIMFN